MPFVAHERRCQSSPLDFGSTRHYAELEWWLGLGVSVALAYLWSAMVSLVSGHGLRIGRWSYGKALPLDDFWARFDL